MFDEPRDALFLLQRWYLGQCDGEWEHSFGVSIETLDNPGWTLRVELQGSPLEHRAEPSSKVERSEHDWVHWRIEGGVFEAACGPTNLNEAILAFLDVAEPRGPSP